MRINDVLHWEKQNNYYIIYYRNEILVGFYSYEAMINELNKIRGLD